MQKYSIIFIRGKYWKKVESLIIIAKLRIKQTLILH